jgi:hypothetical protein
MRKLVTLVIFMLFIQITGAQESFFYQSYDWEKQPSYSKVDVDGKDMLGLKNHIISEFHVEDGAFVEYYLEHETLLLNSDDKIEEYNKVYLPYDSSKEILVHKARVINKDGNVINIPDDKIFEAVDEESDSKYQYFALEGLEKGSVLERIYVYKRDPQYTGRYLRLQEDYDKYDVKFQLICPDHLVFDFKSYNDLPIQKAVSLDGKNSWVIASPKIEGIDREEGASYAANTQYVVYKLDSNKATPGKKIVDYEIVAKNIYQNLIVEISKRGEKAIKEIISNTLKGKNQDEKLTELDRYIKENFYLTDIGDEKFSDIEKILKDKIANNSGIMRLYLGILKKANIPYEIVLTSSRDKIKFDSDFESYNFLQEYLIYFPETKKYTAPTDFSTRYGFPDGYWTDTYGLFINEVKVGDFVSSIGEVKFINAVAANETLDLMKLDVKFDPKDISTVEVDFLNEITGYSAANLQPYMYRMDDDNRDQLYNAFAYRLTEEMDILKKEVKNSEQGMFGKAPLVFDYSFTSTDFVEKAGDKYLFKLGKFIGSQTELYQEKERKLPFDNSHNRTYERTIIVEIPEGYMIANPEDIVLEHEFKNESGKVVFIFKSSYEMKANVLTVNADEFYDQTVVPVKDYEAYRTVINSAADFEKVTLILTKKG